VTSKVVDFGVARMMSAPGQAQHAMSVATQSPFTPRYAAPEQWDPTLGQTGAPSDIFALGLLVAEACTFRPSILGDNPAQILRSVMDTNRPMTITGARPDLPRGLDVVVARATRVLPHERYRSVREMQEALRAVLRDAPVALAPALPYALPPAASTVTPVVPPGAAAAPDAPSLRRAKTARTLGIVAIIAVTALLGLVAVLVFIDRSRTTDAPQALATAPPAPGLTDYARLAKEMDKIFGDDDPPGSATPPRPKAAASGKPSAVANLAPNDPAKTPARRGSLRYAGVVGADPFWTQGEIADVVSNQLGGVQGCYAQAVQDGAALTGTVDLIVSITTSGATENVMCSVRDNRSKDAQVFCACVSARASSWKFPPPHGSLGMLKTGSPIVELALP
jgi:hypothetical protein